MRNSLRIVVPLLLIFLVLGRHAAGDEPASSAKKLVEEVVAAAGGEDKLLKLFRYRERVLITSTPAAPVAKDEKGNRTSVVQVGGDIWIGTAKRDKEKVNVLCWAYSLRILLDPKSKMQTLPDIEWPKNPRPVFA